MKTLMILCTVPDERLEMVLKEAKELQYKTVACVDKVHESAYKEADVFYITNGFNVNELVGIGKKEKIDGVVGLCDAAVIPAAAIAEALGLPGNTPASVRMLLSKSDFRKLQQQAEVFCPQSKIVSGVDDIMQCGNSFKFPIIIKPMLASSSHGMTVIDSNGNKPSIEKAFLEAKKVSRNGEVCAEEYIVNEKLRIIEADIFVVGDDILWDGIRYCYRLHEAPLRPVYDVYPVSLSQAEMKEFKHSVTAVIRRSGAQLGEFNVEGFFTPEGRFFILEINPRQAGHYNPQDIKMYCGVDLTRLLITTAVGDLSYYLELKSFIRECNCVLSYSVFSSCDGVFERIHIDDSLRAHLKAFRYLHGQKPGDKVQNIRDAVRPIAKAVFTFDTTNELENARGKITEFVYPVVAKNIR